MLKVRGSEQCAGGGTRDHCGSGQLELGREKGEGMRKERRDEEDRSERLGKQRREARQCEDGRRSPESFCRRLDRDCRSPIEEHISIY